MPKRKIKVLSKSEMVAAGTFFNYESILNKYLEVMPFNERERKEVRCSLEIKINCALDMVNSGKDPNALKKLKKRFKQLKQAAEEEMNRNRRLTKEEEDAFFRSLGEAMHERH